MLALKIKDLKNDNNEWIEIDTGYEIVRVTAKKTRQGLNVIIDAPDHIKITRESLIGKQGENYEANRGKITNKTTKQ